MEKTESPPSDSKTAAQSPPFDCHQANDHDQFASNFTSLYHSIFPPKPSQLPNSLSFTPSTTASPSSSSAADEISTENRLRQARLILEYQDLCDHYNLSLARLQTLTNELELIRRENADLRVTNSELVKLISLSSEAAVMQHQNRTFGNNRDVAFERRNNANNVERERVTLPKSISVRSSGFVKVNQAVSGNVSNNGGGRGSASSNSTRSRVASQHDQLVSGSVSWDFFEFCLAFKFPLLCNVARELYMCSFQLLCPVRPVMLFRTAVISLIFKTSSSLVRTVILKFTIY